MNTAAKAKKIVGPRGRRTGRSLIEAWLWLMSWAPTHALRVAALRMAGAKIGSNVAMGRGVRVLNPWQLSVGADTIIGLRVCLDARAGLTIGDNCNISDEIAIWTAEHDLQCPDFAMTANPVHVGNRVWLCFRSIVLPGITVGEGSVVASGAVVTKDVPPFSIAAGVPAKVIGKRNEHLVYRLGKSAL